MNVATADDIRVPQAATTAKAGRWLVLLFLISLLLPIVFSVGTVSLMPHRLFLLAAFPFALWSLLSGRCGRLNWIDGLMIASTLWSVLAIFVSTPGYGVSAAIQASGIYVVEFLGAYLMGRVLVRNVAQFRGFARYYLFILAFLTPFAVAEAVTHKPILLDMVPNSIPTVYSYIRFGMRRAQTVFVHPIAFGVFASTAFGLFWFVFRPGVGGFIGAAISAVATFVSLSAGAFISLIVQSMFIAWDTVLKKLEWRWRLFGGLAATAYLAIDLISERTPFHVLVNYASFNHNSAYNRIRIWTYGTDNVARNPMFGLGLDVNNWERPAWMSASADNFWLLTAMTYGLPALIALAGAVYLIFRRVARSDLKAGQARGCKAGFLVAMAGVVIAGGTVHYWHAMLAFIMFLMGSGVWMTQPREEAGNDEVVPKSQHEAQQANIYTRFEHRPRARDSVSEASNLMDSTDDNSARPRK